jgi:solute carrier family 25 phosphate transporter 3
MATAMQEKRYPLGKIEPNSLKYFGACTMGGIIGVYLLKRITLLYL